MNSKATDMDAVYSYMDKGAGGGTQTIKRALVELAKQDYPEVAAALKYSAESYLTKTGDSEKKAHQRMHQYMLRILNQLFADEDAEVDPWLRGKQIKCSLRTGEIEVFRVEKVLRLEKRL